MASTGLRSLKCNGDSYARNANITATLDNSDIGCIELFFTKTSSADSNCRLFQVREQSPDTFTRHQIRFTTNESNLSLLALARSNTATAGFVAPTVAINGFANDQWLHAILDVTSGPNARLRVGTLTQGIGDYLSHSLAIPNSGTALYPVGDGPNSLDTDNHGISIGSDRDATSTEILDGSIAEVRVYSAGNAPSDTDLDIYRRRFRSTGTSGLIYYWRMNEVAGSSTAEELISGNASLTYTDGASGAVGASSANSASPRSHPFRAPIFVG